ADVPSAPSSIPDGRAHHADTTALKEEVRVPHETQANQLRITQKIFLEDLDFTAVPCPTATAWANKIASWVFEANETWRQIFTTRFVVLPDSAFDFLCETGTEVHTRVRIKDDTKTVAKGQLWTEESLPAETILMGLIQCDRVFQKNDALPRITETSLLEEFAKNPLTLQIGGKATVGRGQVRCLFTEVK
ncbi:MAG: type III-B CRISPR module RAMP protein Cmr4, partial [Gemmataceae bacterium]